MADSLRRGGANRFAVEGENFVTLDPSKSAKNHRDFYSLCYDMTIRRSLQYITSSSHYNLVQVWKEAKNKRFPNDLYTIAYAYTVDVPNFYQEVNKTLREALDKTALPTIPRDVLPFAALLYRSINMCTTKISCQLYRGVPGSIKFNKPVGSLVNFGSFMSTSKKREEAEKFGGPNGILFIIERNSVGLDLMKCTKFPNEAEVLFEPFANFRVKAVRQNGAKQEVMLEQENDDLMMKF